MSVEVWLVGNIEPEPVGGTYPDYSVLWMDDRRGTDWPGASPGMKPEISPALDS